jgi:hypothetical protein
MNCDLALWWNTGAFVYVGRMGDNKGVEHILTAWCTLKQRLPDRCPDLWIIGGEPFEIETVRRKSLELTELAIHEASGRVRWWGYLNEEGISAILLKACVLVMHSSYEPGGRVILEAMAQGVPVIATHHGFALDLVGDWETGFIVPYGDIEMLYRRMEHFARMPLLGISLGKAARATAHNALNDWDFFKAHEDVYLRALNRAEPAKMDSSPVAPAVICNPMPHGVMGVYPFPIAVPDTTDAVSLAAEVLGTAPNKCTVEQVSGAHRSFVWNIHSGGEAVVVKHSYTTYVRRPLWDRSYSGPLIRQGKMRREKELAASRLPDFASILKADELLGLHAYPYLPAVTTASPIEFVRTALGPLSRLWSIPITKNCEHLIGTADHWWRERSAALWRYDGKVAAELRCSSLRIAWAEMRDKVKAQDFQITASLAQQLEVIASECDRIAGQEADIADLCYQHGDFSSAHVRRDGGGTCLIDGEKYTVGWWGRDAAFLLIRGSDIPPEEWWDEALLLICDTPEKQRLVLLWVLIEAVNEIARITALQPAKTATQAWQWWEAMQLRLSV